MKMGWAVGLIGALIGGFITLSIVLGTTIFNMGKQTARLEALEQWKLTVRGDIPARVEELERWRGDIRKDMHEVSDALASVGLELKRLGTLIEERTRQRRHSDRET